MIGIDETLDYFDYADTLVDRLIENKKSDGELSMAEVAGSLASSMPAAVRAYFGSDQIKAELADLDEPEKDILINRSIDLVVKLAKLGRPV